MLHPVYHCAVLEFDRQADGQLGNLGRKILQKKFESFNKTWLQAVEQEYAHHGYDYGVGIPGPGVGSMMADDQFFNDKVAAVSAVRCCFHIDVTLSTIAHVMRPIAGRVAGVEGGRRPWVREWLLEWIRWRRRQQ